MFLSIQGCGTSTTILNVAPKAPDCAPLTSSGKGSVSCVQEGKQAFATVVEECGISDTFTTRATTRQLLVGLSDIKFISQDTATYGDARGLLSVISAKYDLDSVTLVVFSKRTDACVNDTIVWKKAPSTEEDKNLSEDLKTLLESIVLNSSIDTKGNPHASS